MNSVSSMVSTYMMQANLGNLYADALANSQANTLNSGQSVSDVLNNIYSPSETEAESDVELNAYQTLNSAIASSMYGSNRDGDTVTISSLAQKLMSLSDQLDALKASGASSEAEASEEAAETAEAETEAAEQTESTPSTSEVMLDLVA